MGLGDRRSAPWLVVAICSWSVAGWPPVGWDYAGALVNGSLRGGQLLGWRLTFAGYRGGFAVRYSLSSVAIDCRNSCSHLRWSKLPDSRRSASSPALIRRFLPRTPIRRLAPTKLSSASVPRGVSLEMLQSSSDLNFDPPTRFNLVRLRIGDEASVQVLARVRFRRRAVARARSARSTSVGRSIKTTVLPGGSIPRAH